MRYLVTGALGAIGAWTVRALLDRVLTQRGDDPAVTALLTDQVRQRQ